MSEKTKSAETTDKNVIDSPAKKPSSFVALKIFAVILLAGSLAGFFIPVYFSFADGGFKAITSASIIGENESMFMYFVHTLKTYFESEMLDYLKRAEFFRMVYHNKYLFGIALAELALIITTIVTLCTKKSVHGWFRASCVISFIVFTVYGGYLLAEKKQAFDLVLVFSALYVLALIIHTIAHGKKNCVLSFICFLLLAAGIVMALLFNFFGSEGVLASNAFNYFFDLGKYGILQIFTKEPTFPFPTAEAYQILTYVTILILAVNAMITACGMGFKKTGRFTVIRYFIQLALTVASLVLTILAVKPSVTNLIPFIVLTALVAVAFFASFICVCATRKNTKEKEKTTVEDALEKEMDEAAAEQESASANEPTAEGTEEESATVTQTVAAEEIQEASTPVTESVTTEEIQEASTLVTESVTTKEAKEEPVKEQPTAQPLQPQYYPPMPNIYINISPNGIITANGAGQNVPVYVKEEDDGVTDEFIETLSAKDRSEFKKTFLKGNAPAYMPEYKVGKDNKHFFDSVFVYLGKIRMDISESLLASIYDYMQKKK